MIKFGAKNERGRPMIGLGITEMNVLKMKSGQPIHIHADELGFAGEIVIFYGETEDQIAAMMRGDGVITAETDVRDHRKKKRH